ncbi:MAG: hypothetical protein NTAFB01_09820 [Nitrospira sp.]
MRAFAEKPRTGRDNFSWGAVAVALSVGLAHGMYDVVRVEASEALLDCKKFETKEPDFGMPVKGVGQFRFATGPEFSKAAESWDLVVYGIIARYAGLCTRFNAGLATKPEYETGLKEIDGYYREAKELEAKLSAAVRHRRDGAHSIDTGLERAVADLATRMRQAQGLEQISAPLKPGRPQKPRPILGAPGRAEEQEIPLSR